MLPATSTLVGASRDPCRGPRRLRTALPTVHDEGVRVADSAGDRRRPLGSRNPRNRDRTRVSQAQLRAILLNWDPIGVADNAHAQDEYDCLISPLMHQMFHGSTACSLAAWIGHERVEHFGLPATRTTTSRWPSA